MRAKYGFGEMKEGDRVVIKGTDREIHLAWSAARTMACLNRWKFRYHRTEDSLEVYRVKPVPPSVWGVGIKRMLEGEIWSTKELDVDEVARDVHAYGAVKNKRFEVMERKGVVYVRRISLEEDARYWSNRRTTYSFERLEVGQSMKVDWKEGAAVGRLNRHGRARYITNRVKDGTMVKRVA